MKTCTPPPQAAQWAGSFRKTCRILAGVALLHSSALWAADGTWTFLGDGNWSNPDNWADGVIADGAGAIADLSQIDPNGVTVIARVDGTNRILGTVLIGDINNSNAVQIANSGGGSLIFNNLGETALFHRVESASNTAVSAPMLLEDSLEIRNSGTGANRFFEIRGGVSAHTSGTKTVTLTGFTTGRTEFTSAAPITDGAGVIALVQENAGSELRLSSTANTYSGGTVIRNGGLVTVVNNNSLGSNAGAVTFDNGRLFFSSTNTTTNVAREGILQAGGGTIQLAPTSTITWSGVISGSGGLTKAGVNTSSSILILSGSNSYTGGTTIDAGVLRVSADENLGAPESSVTINAGQLNIIDAAPNVSFNREMILTGSSGLVTVTGGNSASWNGVISGDGMLRKQFAGLLALTGSNTYLGGTSLEGGTLQIFDDVNLGASGGEVIFAGSSTTTILRISQSMETARPLVLNQVGILTVDSGQTAVWNGEISGAQTLHKRGSGVLTLTGSNSFVGGIRVEAGELGISADENLGQAGVPLIFQNGATTATLATNNSLVSDRPLEINGNTLRFGIRGGTNVTVWDGVISGSGELDKRFVGTLVLTQANTYAGGTVVTTGALLANNETGSATGSGSITVNAEGANGPVILGGNGFIQPDFGQTITVFGTLQGGNGDAAAGILSIAGDVIMAEGSVLSFALGADGLHSSIARTDGFWTFANNQAVKFLDFGVTPGLYENLLTGLDEDPGVANWTIVNEGWTGTFLYDSGNVSFAVGVIPEPGSLALVGLGLAGLIAGWRRKRA